MMINLCLDVQLEILKYLKSYDILQLRNTCKYFTNLIPECNHSNGKVWNIPSRFPTGYHAGVSLLQLVVYNNNIKDGTCKFCETFKSYNNPINMYWNYPAYSCRECVILRSIKYADSNRNFGFPYNCNFPNPKTSFYSEQGKFSFRIHHDRHVLQRDIIEYVNRVLKFQNDIDRNCETFVECKTYLEAKKKALQVKEYVKQYHKDQKKMELKQKEIEYNQKSQYDQIMYKTNKLYDYWKFDEDTSMHPSVTNDLERIKDIIDADGGIDFLYSKQCDIKKSIKGYLKSSFNRMSFWERKFNNED
jgi:hypothetical protein